LENLSYIMAKPADEKEEKRLSNADSFMRNDFLKGKSTGISELGSGISDLTLHEHVRRTLLARLVLRRREPNFLTQTSHRARGHKRAGQAPRLNKSEIRNPKSEINIPFPPYWMVLRY